MLYDSIILASGSPRRYQLLQQIGVKAQVHPVSIDETPLMGEVAADYVRRLALGKAAAGWDLFGTDSVAALPVLGADTIVVIDGDILGKPVDLANARHMLERLSGRDHEVLTAVALQRAEQVACIIVSTQVRFRQLDANLIERYWHTGEPQDKAGAYGIQGLGAIFVAAIQGSYSNVVGLPLTETSQLLERFKVAIWHSN